MSADEQPTAPGGPPAPGAPPGAPPAAGRLIGGYLLEELAGAGGMGVVYRARERSLGRAVALKLIAPQYARDPRFRALFVQESLAAAALEHPNVVPIYRAGEDQGELFIAMRYVEGQNLAELIAAHGRLAPALVGRILAQAAAALDAAHAHGLVHRDVKPHNILISGEEGQERVYLTDFGLSAPLTGAGPRATGGHVTGTLGYLAPEQIRGGPLDGRTDVYALGCVLHHALTGALPFPERDPAAVLVAHLASPPPRPSALRPELPAGFDQVIARALSKRPADRYQSAGALAEAALALRFDVVFCHGPTERAAAAELAERLLGRGLEPWWAAGRVGAGQDPARAEREGLRGSACCAVLVGPDGLGEWARQPLALAERLGLPLVSVLTPGAPEPFDPRLSFLAGRPWVDLRGGLDEERGLQALLHAIRREARLGSPVGSPPADAGAVCPYRGLEAFGEADARFFCGREEETELLVERLRAGRVVCVLGPSGSGKSSLVRAGLVPALKSGALAGSERWTYLSLRPGARPLEALCAALAGAVPEPDDALTAQALRADPAALDSWLSAAMADRPGDERALVVVDQLEELFALCAERGERRAFLEALRYGAAIPGGRLATVLCMRADFYHRLAEHPPLHELAAAHQQLVGPLGQEELRRVIAEPAARAGLELEPGLTEAMLDDLAERPGALPLLQHLLLELWQRRRGAELTLEAYAQTGGVQGALGARAEALYQALKEPERQIARRALLRLVVPGEGAEDTRRRAERRELAGTQEEEPRLERVLGALAGARLVSLGRDQASGEPTVELAHEALIRGWPRLSGWIAEEREGLRAQARLAEGAREWEQAGRDEALLLRGARLAGWAERGELGLSALEREFLAASRLRAERERRARGRRLRLAFGGLAGGLAAVSAVAGVALWQRSIAIDRGESARSRLLAASAADQLGVDPQLSLLLALRAVEASPTSQAEQALRQATHDSAARAILNTSSSPDPTSFVEGQRFDRAGDRLVTWGGGSLGQMVRVWDLRSGRPLRAIMVRRGGLDGAALSRDGRRVLILREGAYVRRHNRLLEIPLPKSGPAAKVTIWDAQTGRYLRSLGSRPGERLDLSPDGHLFAGASGSDPALRVVDWEAGREVRLTRPDGRRRHAALFYYRALGFSGDDRRVAACGRDSILRVWELGHPHAPVRTTPCDRPRHLALDATGARVASIGADLVLHLRSLGLRGGRSRAFRQPSSSVGVAFAPDGRVVTANADGTLMVWDPASGASAILRGQHQQAREVVVSPDGRTIASSDGGDGTLRLWDIDAALPRILIGDSRGDAVSTVDPAGNLVAGGGDAGRIRIWDLRRPGRRPLRVLDATAHQIQDLSFGAAGHLLASSGTDGILRVWDWRAGRVLVLHRYDPKGQLRFHPVAMSRDGRLVAIGALFPTRVWHVTGGPPQPLPPPGIFTSGGSGGLMFSPDGRQLAMDGGQLVWTLDRPKRPVQLTGGASTNGYGVDVSRDGRLVAGAFNDGSVRVWDLPHRRLLANLSGHQGPAYSVRFSPDGRLLVSAGTDGTARVWDWRAGTALLVLHGGRGALLTVTFANGGRLVVTAGEDGAIRIWPCDVCGPIGDVIALARRRAVRSLSAGERSQFLVG